MKAIKLGMMPLKTFINFLQYMNNNNIYFFKQRDIESHFGICPEKAKKILKSAYYTGLVKKIANERDIYRCSIGFPPLEHCGPGLMDILYEGEINYLSFESALSFYGVIDQIPYCNTVATTGESNWINSEFGRFCFVHVNSFPSETEPHQDGYWIATMEQAIKDTIDTNSNVDLINWERVDDLRNEKQK